MNRHRLATLGIPVLALCAALGWTLSARDALPDPVASHFDFTGRPDGFQSLTTLSLGMLGTGLLLLLLFQRLCTTRLMSGIGAGTVIFVAALQVLILAPQRGLADAADTTLGAALPLALIVATAGGALVGVLADPPPAEADPVPADSVPLRPGTRAAWFGTARATGFPLWIMLGGMLPLVAFAVSAFLDGAWIPAFLLFLTVPVFVMFLGVDVRVDAHGTHWQLFTGIPRGTIPHAVVTRVGAVDIRPGDWGGWGWRLSLQGRAILIRGGEGLRIQRGKKNFYITVDDAARGAALIEAYRGN